MPNARLEGRSNGKAEEAEEAEGEREEATEAFSLPGCRTDMVTAGFDAAEKAGVVWMNGFCTL